MMNKNVEFKNGNMVVKMQIEEVCKGFTDFVAHFPVYDRNKDAWKFTTLVCDFHFVKDKTSFARLVECAYMVQTVSVLTTAIDKIKKAEDENRATIEQSLEKKQMQELREFYNELTINLFSKEQIAFSTSDNFVGFCAAYFSKKEVDSMKLSGVIQLLNNLAENKSANTIKQLLQTVVGNFTVSNEDDIYLKYRFNASATLTDEIIKVYYKGRKVSKGFVKQAYDTNGKSVKQEIILAVIEDLQKKSRKHYEEEVKKEEEREKKEERKKETKKEK